jgi:hypothetical protein
MESTYGCAAELIQILDKSLQRTRELKRVKPGTLSIKPARTSADTKP